MINGINFWIVNLFQNPSNELFKQVTYFTIVLEAKAFLWVVDALSRRKVVFTPFLIHITLVFLHPPEIYNSQRYILLINHFSVKMINSFLRTSLPSTYISILI